MYKQGIYKNRKEFEGFDLKKNKCFVYTIKLFAHILYFVSADEKFKVLQGPYKKSVLFTQKVI